MNESRRIAIPTPFQVGRVNCYVFDDDGLTLVDPGPASDDAREALVAGLAERDATLADVERILITHPHMDHYGATRQVVEASGASVQAHPDATRILQDPDGFLDLEQAYFGPYLRSMGVPERLVDTVVSLPEPYADFREPVAVDAELRDGDGVALDGQFEAIHTPGHAPGSLCFVAADGSVAYTGDHVMAHISPNPMLTLEPGTDDERTRSLPTYVESLERLRACNVEVGYAGHGETVTDVTGRIDEILAHHRGRKDRIASFLDAEAPASAYAVMQELFPDLPVTETFAGMSEVVGHLDLLEDEGAVELDEAAGVIRYRSV